MSVRHVVCWKLAATAPSERAAQAQMIKTELEALRARVPGLLEIEVGIDVGGGQGHYDVVLVSLFADAEALADYQTSALHAQAGRRFAGAISARVAVDYNVQEG